MRHKTHTIVVTGGAGFIGSHLVDCLLLDANVDVVVIDDLSSGQTRNLARHQADRRLKVIHGDVRDGSLVGACLRGADLVFHLAARSSAVDSDAEMGETFTTNVVGTFNVLRAAAAHHVSRVVFASSYVVYGEPITLPVEEGHPLLAIDSNGASKVAGEAYCRAFRRAFGLQTTVLRLAQVYGPRDNSKLISGWLNQAAAGQDLGVAGGKQVMDYVWIGDTVEALVRAGRLNQPTPPINVASGTGTQVADVARLIRRLVGSRSQIRTIPGEMVGITRFVANVERMRQVLRIEPPLDPLCHLRSMVQAHVGGPPGKSRLASSCEALLPSLDPNFVYST